MDKKSLRMQFLAARAAIDPFYAKTASAALAEHLAALIPPSAGIIAGYCAARAEINISPALKQLEGRGSALCLPVVQAKNQHLIFRHWRVGQILTTGMHNIEIPAEGAEVIPEVIIAPLVAFDRHGHRLGSGAGYYDRTIAHLRSIGSPLKGKRIIVIGAAFAAQETTCIPTQAHDAPLDAVVTEKEIIRFT